MSRSKKLRSYLEFIAQKGDLESIGGDLDQDEPILEFATAQPGSAGPAPSGGVTPRTALTALRDARELSDEEAFFVEAIILPKERPVAFVRDDDFETIGAPFHGLNSGEQAQNIRNALPAIGRIELPYDSHIPYGGTGFLVGSGILMTNRHVAELFTSGLGRRGLVFRPGHAAEIDFKQEYERAAEARFQIVRPLAVHPYWDMALLKVSGLEHIAPLKLSAAPAGDCDGRTIAVVGYPALDPRNDVKVQNQVFGGVYNKKRLQPGHARGVHTVRSFGKNVAALTHDASTLGGNSGSAVIDVQTGHVLALHFAGRYLEANYAVPTREMLADHRLRDLGLNAAEEVQYGPTKWEQYWIQADELASETADGSGRVPPVSTAFIDAPSDGPEAHFTIPLQVSVRIGSPAISSSLSQRVTTPLSGPEPTERMVEPYHEADYENRRGYDERFLGVRVPVPQLTNEHVASWVEPGEYLIPYEHFSVVMHRYRRMAIFTASNVDFRKVKRQPDNRPSTDYRRKTLGELGDNDQERWFTDPRIPRMHQLPDRFFTYDRKAFDKGHLVRRDDVAWGETYDELRRANGDTYHVTNCSPQVGNFNQSQQGGLWGKLENLVGAQGKHEKLCVFGGPILHDDDPVFHGKDYQDVGSAQVKIPQEYWKVVVSRAGDEIQCFGYLLQQDLSKVRFTEFVAPPEWEPHERSLADLEAEIGLLTFPERLHLADQHA